MFIKTYSSLFLSSFLFAITSSIYGYITGSTFFPFSVYISRFMFNIFIILSIVFMIIGLVKISFNNYFIKLLNPLKILFISIIILFIISMISIFSNNVLDLGRIFRIYLVPTLFYSFLVISLVIVIFSSTEQNIMNVKQANKFFISSILTLCIGIIFYFIKPNTMIGNYNFLMQFLLSMLCIVLPFYFIGIYLWLFAIDKHYE